MIAGRTTHKKLFSKWESGPKSEFVVVYGRRRVGKTYLVRKLFENQFSFYITGLANTDMEGQLQNFHFALQQYGSTENDPPESWLEAFQRLQKLLAKSRRKKKIVFIDELPWLDTPRSQFLPAFEHFWNHWASARNDVLLIACGSAASWIIGNLLNNTDGLHNRVTQRVHLKPFTLAECEAFFELKNMVLDRYQLVQLYMAFGGVPFYLEAVERGQSAAQNINRLCFGPDAPFAAEFQNLFASLFKNSETHTAIVRALGKKTKGLTRNEVSNLATIPTGGTLTNTLNELEASGFIRIYTPFEKKKKDSLYQLTDPFSLFHMAFMESKSAREKNYWLTAIDSPSYRSWAGFAFERVCFAHSNQIKRALGISGIQTAVSSWRSSAGSKGAQIDLLIERRDHVITVCEIKFSQHRFEIVKKYADELRQKLGAFKQETETRMAVMLALITTFGIEHNAHSAVVQNEIQMSALFAPGLD